VEVRLTACVTTQASCTIVTLGGYIDLSTGKQLQDVLNAAAKAASHLIVDMSRLGFMDSTGLSVLIDMHKRLDARGNTLALAAPQPIVAKVLAISGLDRVLSVHPSVAQAVAVADSEAERSSDN
jgi:anti-sigma B factor antagonist